MSDEANSNQEPPRPPDAGCSQTTWKIVKGEEVAYRIYDDAGQVRGSFRDADAIATHLVFAMQRCQNAEAILDRIGKAAEASLPPELFQQIKEYFWPPTMKRIDIPQS